MVVAVGEHREAGAVPLDPAVDDAKQGGFPFPGFAIDGGTAHGINQAVAHFDEALRQSGVEVSAVLAVGYIIGAHGKRVDRHGVQRQFIAGMIRIGEVEVIAHDEGTGRNRLERGGIPACRCAATHTTHMPLPGLDGVGCQAVVAIQIPRLGGVVGERGGRPVERRGGTGETRCV